MKRSIAYYFASILCCLQGCIIAFAPARLSTSFIAKHSSIRSKSTAISDRRKLVAESFSSDPKISYIQSDGSRKTSPILFSFSILAACRRLSFLLLSVALVNSFRTAVLKASRHLDTSILCSIILPQTNLT